jgi:hypothetical protein
MVGRGAIYARETNCDEASGPYHKVFLIDSAAVFALMEKVFGKTGFWINAKQFARKKEGRRAWLTLIKHHFGDDRATTLGEALRTKLQNAVFAGPKRNFDFIKYCNLHTANHSTAMDILKYQPDQTPILSESQKIQLFQSGITDPYFATIKGLVNSQRHKYDTFEKVKDVYLNYTRTSPRPELTRETNDQLHLSETKTRGTRPGAKTRDRDGKPSQLEIDACTHITLKKYLKPDYAKFTLAERAKLYQLRVAAGQYEQRPPLRNAQLLL